MALTLYNVRSIKGLRRRYKRLASELGQDDSVLDSRDVVGYRHPGEVQRDILQRTLEEIPRPEEDVTFGTSSPYERHVVEVYYQKALGLFKDSPTAIGVRLLNLGFRPAPVKRNLKRKLPGTYGVDEVVGAADDQVRRETNLAYATMALRAEENARKRKIGKMMSSMMNIIREMERSGGEVMERRMWNAFDIPHGMLVYGHGSSRVSTLEGRASNAIKMAWRNSTMFKRYVFWGPTGCGDIYNADLRVLWLRKVCMGFRFRSARDDEQSMFPKARFWLDMVRNFPCIEWELAEYGVFEDDGSPVSALSLNFRTLQKLADALHVFEFDGGFDWIGFIFNTVNYPPSFEVAWFRDTLTNLEAHLAAVAAAPN